MSKHLNQIQNWPERALAANWSASALAKNCGVSLRTLERFFHEKMRTSPKAWFSEQRQQQADKLIKDGLSVKEAAENLGYKHQNHLTNAFTKHWGICPTDRQSPPPA